MKQSRKMSLVESLISTGIGYTVAVSTQILIFPIFGVNLEVKENMAIAFIFTLISIIRSYFVRRLFNNL